MNKLYEKNAAGDTAKSADPIKKLQPSKGEPTFTKHDHAPDPTIKAPSMPTAAKEAALCCATKNNNAAINPEHKKS